MRWKPHTEMPTTGMSAVIAVFSDNEVFVQFTADYYPTSYDIDRNPLKYEWHSNDKSFTEMPQIFYWLDVDELMQIEGLPKERLSLVR